MNLFKKFCLLLVMSVATFCVQAATEKVNGITIWSTGFENYAVGDMLVGTSGSHFLNAGYYSDDNESVVGSHGGVIEFDEPCGYASPFTDMGTKYFNVNTNPLLHL